MPQAAPAQKPFPIRKVISGTILCLLLLVVVLMFLKPAPVAQPMAPAAVQVNAKAFQEKIEQLTQPATSDGSAPAEVRFTTDEVQAALVEGAREGAGSVSTSGGTSQPLGAPAGGGSAQSASAPQVSLASAAPVINFEGDVVRGQFQAELAGQPVTVTVAGHLGASDGYATFEPTEFKIGQMSVPVSLVNSQLQKKMQDERDKMKLPDGIAGLRVENGQLVIVRK